MKSAKGQDSEGKEGPDGKLSLKRVLSLICALALLSFIILFFTNHVIALILSLSVVPPNLPISKIFYVFIPFPVPVFVLYRSELLWYFPLIVACLFISIIWLVKSDIKRAMNMLIDAIKLERPLKYESKNSIILIGQLLFAYYFFYVIYWSALDRLELFSLNDSSEGIPPMGMFIYANSPVYEEVVYRVLMIGVPLLIFTILLGKFRKRGTPIYRYILGGKFKLKPLALIWLVLSSIVFAAGHVWKSIYAFPPILIIGLMFGYLFLKKGVHTAIILHFSVTYMDMLIFADNSGYVPLAMQPFLGISIIARYLMIAFGIVAGPFYFYRYGKSAITCCVVALKELLRLGNKRGHARSGHS